MASKSTQNNAFCSLILCNTSVGWPFRGYKRCLPIRYCYRLNNKNGKIWNRVMRVYVHMYETPKSMKKKTRVRHKMLSFVGQKHRLIRNARTRFSDLLCYVYIHAVYDSYTNWRFFFFFISDYLLLLVQQISVLWKMRRFKSRFFVWNDEIVPTTESSR